ncbi:hypothetical protein, partial [Nocardia abscessus]|uniref:hypothetical protein n=1 Tax=Nocardia abscessus TaxID=120957 RepID=UPI002454101F
MLESMVARSSLSRSARPERESDDPEGCCPGGVVSWVRARLGDRSRRRRIAWFLLNLFALFVFPGLLGAVAPAQNPAASARPSHIDGLSWMKNRETSGGPWSSITIST